jgi:CDP-diacylglycerol pyrophosphatase
MRIVLLLLALIVSASGARAAIHRDALWFVLRSCVVAQNTAGIPFPCLAVNLASSTGPGYAVLRAPFNPRGVLVVPVEKIEGIESPILQHPDARAYWQAALESRRFVADALGGRIPLTEVALAVNSSVGRSQDQLHIHLDCLKPSVRFALGHHASAFSARWTFLKFPLEGARYYGLKVGAAQAEVFNPFAALASLPGARGDLRATSLAVVGAPGNDPSGGFYVLAYWGRRSPVEKLLDPTCSDPSRSVAR